MHRLLQFLLAADQYTRDGPPPSPGNLPRFQDLLRPIGLPP